MVFPQKTFKAQIQDGFGKSSRDKARDS